MENLKVLQPPCPSSFSPLSLSTLSLPHPHPVNPFIESVLHVCVGLVSAHYSDGFCAHTSISGFQAGPNSKLNLVMPVCFIVRWTL